MCVLPYCTVVFIGPLCPDIVSVNSMSVACCWVVSPPQELEVVARRAPYLLVIENFISQDSYLFFNIWSVNSMSVACCWVVSTPQELEVGARRVPYLLVIEHFISQDSYLFF